MALFKDEPIEDLEDEQQDMNKYLQDPEQGMELIKNILCRGTAGAEGIEFETLVSDKVLPVLAELKLTDELEVYQFLLRISGKIREQQKIKLLKGKKVLGVGGKFSAGKSCFINSITNADLPEGQRPTTSIATYILNSENKKNIAISSNDNVVELDDEAVAALTHQFYEKHKIGFSKILKNLVVLTPGFTYPNIAILDTPGYSKADASKKENSSDAGMAREQLKSADYLIWLVDAIQGVVTQRDLEFISSLNVNSKILVVFTKASGEIEENLVKKIDEAKKALSGINKQIYDVIAYDSLSRETVIGEGVLEKFLHMINDSDIDSEDLSEQLKGIGLHLEKQISEQVKEVRGQMKKLGNILVKTSNVEHISALVKEYGRCKTALLSLEENKRKLNDNFHRLISITNEMGRI